MLKINMRISKYIFKTQKDHKNLDKATDRIIRACYAQKECSGIFRFTNLGFRVLEKIKKVIRNELDKMNCLEVELPILQDIAIWEKSNRKNAYGPERFNLKDRKGSEMVLAPTAEESATEMMIDIVNSYKQLPITIYQMVQKYRDEMRPRFGLIRSRQFIMKDAYSFAKNEEEATKIYIEFYNCYIEIFKKFGIDVFAVPGEVGDIGGKFSHEFVVLNDVVGESDVFYNELNNDYAKTEKDFKNLECAFEDLGFKNRNKCLELGHIYYLGDFYSKTMKAEFTDSDGKNKNMIMGCYGIGVTRILSYLMESREFLPEIVSPFDIHLVGIDAVKSEELYSYLQKHNISVLYDDRDCSAGVKFNDADLVGIPKRIVIGKEIEFHNLIQKSVKKFDNVLDLCNFIIEN